MKGSDQTKPRRLRCLAFLAAFSLFFGASAPAQNTPIKPVTGPVAKPDPPEKSPEPKSSRNQWTEADTRLANHYIRLLQQRPEYGNVLDLLWGLYDKRRQTELLLAYFEQAATGQEGSVIAKTLFAHLLRKNEEFDRAREIYSEVLDLAPNNVYALRGAAEMSDQLKEKRNAKTLALYTRLVDLTPIQTEEGVAFRLRQAALLRELDRSEEAVATWNALLAAWPGNTALRTEIVSHLMEAGRTDDAIGVLEELAGNEDPGLRLTSLQSLSRLYQYISDFDGAAASLRKAMALVHFKHHEHDELFTHFVRLHERFGRLEELEEELVAEASRDRPSEKSVFLVREFYRLTANAIPEEKWATRLAEIVSENVDYRARLVEIQMENDRYAEAAGTLDALIAGESEPPLRLLLLRVRIALNLEGRGEAESLLKKYLEGPLAGTPEVLEKVLAFSRENYLDGMVEHLLRGPMASDVAGSDGESAPVELAGFLRERGRTRQAIETLREYVAEAGQSPKLRASRLSEVGAAFRDLDLEKQAIASIAEAISLDPENLAYKIQRAEILIDRKEVEEALEIFETVWKKTDGLEARAEIDQRIFSLLRGQIDDPIPVEGGPFTSTPGAATSNPGAIKTVDEYRRLAASAFRNRGRDADEPPPERLLRFYENVKQTAYANRNLESRYRAAWWSFKLQDFSETYKHLTQAQAEAPAPVVEVEKMLFDLAEQNERHVFMAKHLETLSVIDPENAAEYRQRWAEVRFLLGYEDEAVRVLEELAADPDASLNTLKTLASVYQRQGRIESQIRVWEDAYRRANLFEKRRIIKQLTTAFIERDQPEEALRAQLDLIRRETDLVQKRKQFDFQLSVASRHFMLDLLRDRYTELAQQNPFDRFYPEALARIHRAKGDIEAAFLAMKRAYYMSGQDRELLLELGELASKTKDLKSAIYYHRQLIAQNEEGADADSWHSLIEMLERDLRVPEADRMRRRLEGKFAQDADYLKQLALQYGKSGRMADAERLLNQLVSLRPWDAATWLELGLVRKERGSEDAEALLAFEKAIEETAEAALPADEKRLSRIPLISGGWFSGSGTRPDEGGLASFADAARDHPSIDPDLQDAVIDWLSAPRPEFYRVPRKPEAIRLRAIEEAALIHGRNGGSRKAWVRRWSDEENQSPTERLWALHHSGARSEAFAILRSTFQPLKSPADRLLFCVMALRLGETEAVLNWVKEDGAVLQGHEEDRRVYPLLAANLLIREAAEDGMAGFPEEAFQNLLAGLPKSYMTGWHLFNRARESQPDLALAIGNTLSRGNLGGNGDFLYSVAKVAQSLGRNDEYLDWLDRSLVEMDPENGERLPVSYFPALTERYATIESAGDRMQLLVDESLRIESHPAATDRIRHEHRALVALASGNAESAIDSIRALARSHRPYTRTFGRTFNFESEIFSETDHWIRMEEILREFGSRQIPGMNPFEFYESIGGTETPPPVAEDLETREQFEQFEIVRLVWLMERLSPPERARRLQEGFSQLTDPNSKLELASLLEARGFHRESIPIYRELIREDPGDISPLRGFFGACRKSLDFEPPLALIQQYLDGELPTPTGLTADYLSQNHAEFLYMGRDLENLAARAQDPVADPGGLARNPLLSGESQNPWRYHDALVRVHEKRDQPEALLRVLDHLRNRGHATEEDRLLAARVLRGRGDSEAAIDWLNEIQFDQKQIEVEIDAIRELAGLHTDSETPSREKLANLARTALEYDNATLVSDLAALLHGIGAKTEAQSCLLLQARKKGSGISNRTRMLIDLVRLELESGAAFDQIEDNARVLLEGLPSNGGEGTRQFLQLIADFGSRDREAWLDFLGPCENRPATRIPAIIGAATLRGNLDQVGARLAEAIGDDGDEFGRALESLAFLNEAGINAAKALLERWDGPEATLLDGDPMRQIAVFGALKDGTRAAELLSRLLEETASDLFHRFNLANLPGTFVNRWRMPKAFTDAGFPDMAGALFREYHRRIPRLTHEHADFVESYTRYLIDREDFLQAENVLAPAIQKSIGLNPEVLVDLYAASDRLDEIDHLIQKLYLSSGIRVQLKELAAERKM